jgi:hypothetical protein
MVGGWMHNREAEIVDLVKEHLQTKENQNGKEMVGAESKKGKGEEEIYFLRGLSLSISYCCSKLTFQLTYTTNLFKPA